MTYAAGIEPFQPDVFDPSEAASKTVLRDDLLDFTAPAVLPPCGPPIGGSTI